MVHGPSDGPPPPPPRVEGMDKGGGAGGAGQGLYLVNPSTRQPNHCKNKTLIGGSVSLKVVCVLVADGLIWRPLGSGGICPARHEPGRSWHRWSAVAAGPLGGAAALCVNPVGSDPVFMNSDKANVTPAAAHKHEKPKRSITTGTQRCHTKGWQRPRVHMRHAAYRCTPPAGFPAPHQNRVLRASVAAGIPASLAVRTCRGGY